MSAGDDQSDDLALAIAALHTVLRSRLSTEGTKRYVSAVLRGMRSKQAKDMLMTYAIVDVKVQQKKKGAQ